MNNQKPNGSNTYEYEIIWKKDYSGGGNMGVAVDSHDNVIACGINRDEDKGIVVKYDKDGNEVWSDQDLPTIYDLHSAFKEYSQPTISAKIKNFMKDYGYFFDVAVDSRDNIVVAGTFTTGDGKRSIVYVKKYDSGGNTIWEKTYTPFFINLAVGIAIDSNDDIFVVGCGGTMLPPALKGFILKISGSNGRVMWRRIRRRGKVTLYTSVAVDPYNDAIASGFTNYNGSLELLITKFGGKRGWRKRELVRGGNKTPVDIVMDGQGNFVAAGKTGNGVEMHYLLKFDCNFNVLWENVGVTKGFLYGVSIMKNGDIVATGYKEAVDEYYSAVYSKSTGDKVLDMFLGKRVSNFPDDYMRGISVDNEGDVVITGARTIGKTLKVRITSATTPPPPSPPPTPKPPEHPKESWLQRFLRWLFGR